MSKRLIILVVFFCLTTTLSAQKSTLSRIARFVNDKDTGLYSLNQVISTKTDYFYDGFIRRIDFDHRQLVGRFNDGRKNYDILAQEDSAGIYLVIVSQITYDNESGYASTPVYFWSLPTRLESYLSRFNALYLSSLSAKSIARFRLERFGRACGASGAPTEKYSQMAKLVASSDYNSLANWMKEYDYETKVLGAVGLLRLSKKGIQISDEDEKIISTLKNSDFLINFCSGCTFWGPASAKLLIENDPF